MKSTLSKIRFHASVWIFLALVAGLVLPFQAVRATVSSDVLISNLQPSWTAPGGEGVYSGYYGPLNGYVAVSPGTTALYDGREAGIIKAGLTIDPTDGIYEDEGLFGFKPTVTINDLATGPLTYDVENQTGANPVWMTIEIDTGTVADRADNTTYQFVPTTNPAGWHTVDAGAGQWQKWDDNNGTVTEAPISLSAVAALAANTGRDVVRAYLRLGMGNSYHGTGDGTIGWVDKATIGGVTYDFVHPVTTHVVAPASADWFFFNDRNDTPVLDSPAGFQNGPSTPPLGVGSAYMTLTTATAGTVLVSQKYQGTLLSAIQTLSYSTYTNLSPASMAFQINYDPDLTVGGSRPYFGRLVYEPYRNGSVTNGTWQTWDMLNGGNSLWWASNNGNSNVDDTCGQNSPCTLTYITTHWPNIGIRNDALSGIMFKAGSNWNGFAGNADNLSVNIQGNTDLYDFEAAPAVVYVDGAYTPSVCGGHVCGYDAFATIHEGMTAVASGGLIHVAAGTFTETGQVVISKNLTVVGADKATTIIKPGSDTIGTGDSGSWILVNDGITFNLSKVTLDGVGRQIRQGIRFNGSGVVDDVVIQNMTQPGYMGFGIAQGYDNTGARTLTVSNSTFTNYGRIGVQADNGTGSSTVTISGNTFTGHGAGDNLTYGVTVEGGAHATITGNTFINNSGVASSDGSESAGIEASTYFAPGTEATITGNTFHDNLNGILVGYDGADTSVVAAHHNQIYNSTNYGLLTSSSTVTADATSNWWGAALGPKHASNPTGAGDEVGDLVSFSPWCTNAACTEFAPPFNTTTTITPETPDPSMPGDLITFNYSVANAITGGPVPAGTVEVTQGATVLCASAAVDGTGAGHCDYTFTAFGSYTLTATFTPTDAALFNTSSDTETHLVDGVPTQVLYSGDQITEHVAGGILVSTLSTDDTDAGDAWTYTLKSDIAGCDGSGNASFRVGGTGLNELQSDAVLDYELQHSYNVCVEVKDSYNQAAHVSFPVTVLNQMGLINTYRSAGAQDGQILESAFNSDAGGPVSPSTAFFSIGDNAGKRQYRGILSFNTAGLPDNALITKVTLQLRRYGKAGNPFSLGNLLVDSKMPFFGTGPGLQSADWQFTNGVVQSNDVALTDAPNGSFYVLHLDDAAYDWVNLRGTTQLRLRFSSKTNSDAFADMLKFYSGNASGAASKPLLSIEYSLPTASLTLRSSGAYDGQILESEPGSGLGGAVNASGGTASVGDAANFRLYRSFLSFNTAALPDRAVITNVTLRIKRSGTLMGDPFGKLGDLLVDIKQPTFGLTPGLQASDFQEDATHDAVGAITNNPDVSGWYSVSLDPSAFDAVNVIGTTQLRLRFAGTSVDGVSDLLKFFTGNKIPGSVRPQLVIEYEIH